MAMTQAQKTGAYQFFAIAFGAAPGVEYMNQIDEAFATGATLKDVVNAFVSKPQFTSQYPNFFSYEQFADKLIENVVGDSATAAAKTQAKADTVAALNAGLSRGDVIYNIFNNLASKPAGDPDWAQTAKLMKNAVAVAQYFTETLLVNTTDLATLQKAFDGLTPTTDVSSPAAIQAFLNQAGAVPGETFTLTNGTDVATANVFTAGQVYSPGGNDRINSLQDEDVLTGTGSNPTMNLTLGNQNDNGSTIVTPTLNGIETINAVFSNTDGTGLDLQDATGLQNLNVTRISSALSDNAVGSITANQRVELINLPATALSLDLRNSVAYADVNISYRNGELNGNEIVSIDVASAAIEDLVIGAQAIQTNHVNGLVLNVESDSHVQNLNMKGGSTEVADQKLTINAAANFILGDDANANGNYLDDNSAFWGVDGRLAEIEVTGAGDVTIGEVSTRAAGMTLSGGTATGDITVNVTNADGIAASAFTTGFGNDTVVSNGLAADLTTGAGTDTVTVRGNITAASVVDLGGDADTLTVGTSAVNANNVTVLTGQLEGTIAGGATVNTGDDVDTVTLGDVANVSLGEEAVLNTGAGNDVVTLTGSITGDTAGGSDGDGLSAEVNVGDGDDTVTFNLLGQGDQGTLVAGLLTGGTGTNTLTITGNADATAATFDAADADRVTGFQTLNLVSEQAVSAAMAAAINAVKAGTTAQNDDDGQSADYNVDVSEFTGLTTINVTNQAGIIDATAEEATAVRKFAGDVVAHNITRLQGGETINVRTVEAATGVAEARTVGGIDGRIVGSTEIAGDVAADVALALSNASTTDLTADVNIETVDLAGQTDGDVTLTDTTVGATAFTSLNLAVNGSTNRTINLAAGDFATALNLTSNAAAGTTLTLNNVEATTIAAGAVAANLNITTLTSEGKTITTGSGNDVVDLQADVVNSANTLAAAARDTIDLGTGTNRIVVASAMRGAGADTDEVFDNIRNVQEVQIAANANITLDDDAFNTGVSRVLLNANVTTDMDIGVDFDRALTIDQARGSNLDIDNVGNVNLTARLASTGAAQDTVLALTNAGSGTVALEVTVDDVTQAIGSANTGAANDVRITNASLTNEIDTIVLKDSVQTSTVGGAAATAAGVITLTLDAAWAQAADTLTVDASDINDDDLDANGDGDFIDAGSDNATDGFADDPTGADSFIGGRGDIGYRVPAGTAEVGNDILDTQSTVINAAAANYKVNIKGSQLVDVITGTALSDTIDGQAGNDDITGGQGGDTLTGGAGNDTFRVNLADSNGNANNTDTITDFTTGEDKIVVTLPGFSGSNSAVINLSSFKQILTAADGSGDDSLAGSTPATDASPTVVGDAFFDAITGKFVVDVDGNGDVTSGNDIQINITNGKTVAAGDVNYVVALTADGNDDDIVRGGQGADSITGSVDDDTFVFLGSLSTADVNGYIAAGNAAAVGITGQLADVIGYNELTTVRTQSEINTGDTIDGGAGNDTVHVWGTANVALINGGGVFTGIETFVAHSSVTMTDAQLNGLTSLVLSGNCPHTITITNTNGTADTVATVLAKLAFVGQGANTTVTITGTDGVLTAQWNAVSGKLEVVSDTSGVGAAAGTDLGTLVPAAPVLSVAAAAAYVGAYSLSDTAANLAGAAASVLNNATNISATTAASVAQATTIVNATNSGTNTYNLSDSSANLAAAAAAVGNGAGTIAATDPATVAQATAIEAFTNSGANTYNITDSAAALAASSNAVLALAGTVTASTNATVAQAATIDGFAKAVTFSVSDTAANLAAATDAQLDEAVAVSASNAATVAQGVAIDALATAVTFNVADTAANIAGTSADNGGVGNNGYDKAGTITATTTATAAQAGTIAGYTKAVVYSVSDTAAALAAAAAAAARNEAVNLTATTAATVAQATTIEAATNTGVNTYNITDSAANLAASSNAVLTLAGTVTANTNATVAEATTIDGFAKAVTFAVVDSAANIAGSSNAALDEATSITANTNATAADSATIDAFTVAVTYNVVDSSANLAGSSSANLDEAGTVTANDAATAVQAATIAGFAKAVTFNTTDSLANLSGNLTGANLTEARSVGTVTADDTNANFVTAFTTASLSTYAQNSVEVITVSDAGALTLNAQQFGNFIGGTVTLGTDEAMTVSGDATANLGTLSSYGGSGTLTLGVAAGANAYTANLGTSGVTTINLLGTGNHDVTASGSVLETFVLGADYNGGGVLRGLTSGDLLDVDGADQITAFTLQQVNAGDVTAAGEWHFATGVLTYWDNVAVASVSIGLVGVTNVLSDNSDTFTIV